MIKRSTYLCVCEGQQEKMYLAHISKLLNRFPERVVSFNTTIGRPKRLEKLVFSEYDNAALFDQDGRQPEFEESIRVCQNLNRSGQKGRSKKSVYHAYSNVNFDLWLILHKEDFTRPVTANDAYVSDVRRIYQLGREADIKEEAVISRILSQITLDDVRSTILRADAIRASKPQTDAKNVYGAICYDNPDFSLHEFLRTVLKECGEL